MAMTLGWGYPIWLLYVSVSVCEVVSPAPLLPVVTDCGDPKPLLNGKVKYLSITKKQNLYAIEYNCNGPYYAFHGTDRVQYTCAADGVWRDGNNSDIIPPCIPVCGRPEVPLLKSQARIFRGKKAPAGAVPWQVFLSVNGRAGAFVIGDQWVLTAAHNLVQYSTITPKESIKVYVGDNNINKMLTLPHLEVEAVRVHPLYDNPDERNFDHDIALLQLKQKITFNSRVMPLCLPSVDDQYNTGVSGMVSGFGLTEKQNVEPDLLYVKLPLVDQKTCKESVYGAHLNPLNESFFTLTDNMFCAGFPEGGKDACTGDSGGAFTFEKHGRFWAAGIVSWSPLGKCGEPLVYGVYTRISKYTDWINRIIDRQFTDCGDPKPLLNGKVNYLSITKKQYLSAIEYHCNGPYYTFQGTDRVQYTCAADGVWRDGNNSDIIPPCIPVCGRPESVNNNTVPWHISLSVAGGEGAGSVIGARWALTAASNLLPRGAAVTNQEVKLYISGSTLEVTSLHVHPSYSKLNNRTDFNHNIALVKLKSPITFNATVMPLCLPTGGPNTTGQHGLVSAFQSKSSDHQAARLTLVDNGRCSPSRSSGHTDHTLCSELPPGVRPPLNGDTGAALGVEESGKYRVAGVLVGLANKEKDTYGIYTRVSQYQHWITNTIQQHYCEHPALPNLVELVDHHITYKHHSEIQLKCVSKYYRLEGEDKYTCAADGLWRSGTGLSKWPKCVPVCGITDTPTYSSGRILGGRVARLAMVPWQLLIKVPERVGASLLSDRWALTAASVVDRRRHQNLTLYGGAIDSLDKNQVIMVSEKVVIHPGFQSDLSDYERTNFDNDIALIKLSSRVRLSPTLLPVCLPESSGRPVLEGRMGTVSGFGSWEKGRKSRYLRHTAVSEYSHEQCENTPVNDLLKKPMTFTHNMFCAGLEGSDSCSGDSGGPLVQPVVGTWMSGEPYRVKGIVSWGPVCGSKTYYTKVQNYLDWIRETMEKDE